MRYVHGRPFVVSLSNREPNGSRTFALRLVQGERILHSSFRHITVGMLLAMCVGTATGGVVPQAVHQKGYSDSYARVTAKHPVHAILQSQLAAAEQPSPEPGPEPVPPASERQAPSPGPPSTGKATEVPIGRREGYEEEKRKALEIPFHGRPPGATQEDSTVRRGGAESGSCSHK